MDGRVKRCTSSLYRGDGVDAEVSIRFRSCPRYGGDIFVDRDVYGEYLQCLQCGYLHDILH